ncbi:MAG: hypothetical protein OWU33_05425 [Firmicutes bacterium]|nr:hypothetical protein [Bacillota bacterium]
MKDVRTRPLQTEQSRGDCIPFSGRGATLSETAADVAEILELYRLR